MLKTILRSILCALALTSAAPAVQAQVTRFGATTIAVNATTRGTVVGYDSTNGVYLVVSTYGTLRGRFVDRNGLPLGLPFPIQASVNFTHFPTVAFSPQADGGAGGFLVVWHESDLPNASSVHTRLVSFGKNAPIGADNVVSVDGSFWEQYAAVAYSPARREFLIAYTRFGRGVRAVRVNASGAALTSPFTISLAGLAEGAPSVAYNPTNDQYLVVYEGYSDAAGFGFVEARAVQAGSNTLFGAAPTRVFQGGANYITDVSYNPARNQFLAAWYRDAGGGSKTMLGRVINADLTLPGNVTVLSTLWKAYDALGLAYNPLTNSFFMVSHDARDPVTAHEDGGVEVKADGNPVDNGFLVTAHADTKGNFYPRIAAGTDDPNWLVVTSHGFLSTDIQVVAGVAVAGPPPPPPVTPKPLMSIDAPLGGTVQQPIWMAGWAFDAGGSVGSGADAVHVWAWPDSGAPPIFAGATMPNQPRPDVGNVFGSRFGSSGFGLLLNQLPGGSYTLVAYMHSAVSGTFNLSQAVRVRITDPLMSLDTPSPNMVVSHSGFMLGGWALDRGAASGTGVDTLHVWAWPTNGAPPLWLGVVTYGGVRPDLGAILGPQFTNCGYNMLVNNLPAGVYDLAVYSHSSVSGTFSTGRSVRIVVQ